eukprot:MONOS_12378.1-p1 / transcript=MONOS_12378.1 / gene=MONOS_12378 / organism=Monocercomonoides_exilis_PA203 / gene_product=unspecified product / transcript_product=unspecified product / location=Mono_scaffold00681:10089-10394(+) / protein_length=85 / sequence_SO=supercontig / SO=protein_coding / is_pseudo=false
MLRKLVSIDGKRIAFRQLPTAESVIASIDTRKEQPIKSQSWIRPGAFSFRTDQFMNPSTFLVDSIQRAMSQIKSSAIDKKDEGR